MLISDFRKYIEGNIVKDGVFNTFQHTNSNVSQTLCFVDSEKFLEDLNDNKNISAAFVNANILPRIKREDIAIILCEHPRNSFFEFLNYFGQKHYWSYLGEPSIIDSAADVRTPHVASFGVSIGENTVIGENTIIYPGVSIGNNCFIGPNNVIGGEGFEFKKCEGYKVLKVRHFGGVKIGDHVETKEFVSIHKALFNDTYTLIDEHTKIDAHSHIGHANKVGRGVFLCSKSNISGNSIICDGAYIGPGVNIPNRVRVGIGAKVTLGSSISKSVENGSTVSGHFAIEHSKYISHIKKISE